MNEQPTERDLRIWEELYSEHMRAATERRSLDTARFLTPLLAADVDRPALIRHALDGGRNVHTAAWIMRYLPVEDLKPLFPALVDWASTGHGLVGTFREAIERIDRPWVLERIEAEAEPLLREGTYDEYRRFLELYELLDPDLMRRLAVRAAAHPDPDISEAGTDHLVSYHGRPLREEVGGLPDEARSRFLHDLAAFVDTPRPVAG